MKTAIIHFFKIFFFQKLSKFQLVENHKIGRAEIFLRGQKILFLVYFFMVTILGRN